MSLGLTEQWDRKDQLDQLASPDKLDLPDFLERVERLDLMDPKVNAEIEESRDSAEKMLRMVPVDPPVKQGHTDLLAHQVPRVNKADVERTVFQENVAL